MRRFRPVAFWLFVVSLLIRGAFVAVAPNPVCDDEAAHYNYARYISEEGKLPDIFVPWWATDMDSTTSASNLFFYESYQQPGFYSLASIAVPLGRVGPRAFSFILFTVGFALLYLLAPNDWKVGVFLLLPGVVFVSAMTTNESLLFFGAAVLAHALVRKSLVLYLCGLVLMCLAKVTGVGVAAFLGLYFLLVEERLSWAIGSVVVLAFIVPVTVDRLALASQQMGIFQWRYLYEFIPQSMYSGVWHPGLLPTLFSLGVGCCLLLIVGPIVWDCYLKGTKLSPSLAAMAAIVLVWMAFSATHPMPDGRYLYAAVPFLLAHRGGSYESA